MKKEKELFILNVQGEIFDRDMVEEMLYCNDYLIKYRFYYWRTDFKNYFVST